jgi:hypothetical protein
MAVIIFAVTQVLKLPIKFGTKHIKNARIRKMVNATILLIPFALGVFFEYLYSNFVLGVTFSILTGLGYGTAGISLYGVIERFFKIKIENPYETEEGEAVTELVDKVTEDKKVDSKDKDAVKEFWKKVK